MIIIDKFETDFYYHVYDDDAEADYANEVDDDHVYDDVGKVRPPPPPSLLPGRRPLQA